MNPFPDFYKELCSGVRWYENCVMSNRGKNFKAAAEYVYAQLLADPDLQRRPMTENRKHVHNRLCKMDFERVFPALQQEEKKIEDKEWKPASDEHIKKCIAEFDEMMRNAPMNNAFPRIGYKQSVEEGGWLPKKEAPYPVTSVEEAYIKDRHIAYIEYAYEPKTGEKRPLVMSEESFNIEYDSIMLNGK
jgi:hypothetical protein